MNSGTVVRGAQSVRDRDRHHQPAGGKQFDDSVNTSSAALFAGVRDAVTRDKHSVSELVKWVTTVYSGMMRGHHDINQQALASREISGANADAKKKLAGHSKVEKYKARGLKYSIRHISPAILRRQRADCIQSKELSALIEELKQHHDLWDSYLIDFKDSLDFELSSEQKENIVRRNENKLYEIYRFIWPILQQLRNNSQQRK